MSREDSKSAIIYCRVSDKKQKTDGDGLHSQEHRCREYAQARGYVVEEVFHDDVTGGGDFMSRPGMVAVLKYLQKRSRGKRAKTDYVVIFDDLKRFARDTMFHLQLRKKLAEYNADVECLNFKFENTPEGKFVETVIAAQGELERLQNSRQTRQKMKARLERGYWVFFAPIGYRYIKSKEEGKILVRDEPLASLVQEALEGFASGRFATVMEVKRFLDAQPDYPHAQNGEVHIQRVIDLMNRSLYAGYVEVPEWGVSLRQGKHEGLISFAAFQRIQQRLKGRAHAPARKDINADFPLRGALYCADCGGVLTSCWSKGRRAHYPYYLCIGNRACLSYGKSIKRAVIESEFEALLRGLQPSGVLFKTARSMFKKLWDHKAATADIRTRSLHDELAKIEKQVEGFLDRIADTQTPSVITAYEKRIRKLEEDKIVVSEKIAQGGRPLKSFDESLRTALEFVGNPLKLWDSERFENKRMVLKLAFPEGLTYARNEGFRTVNLALPFKALAELSGHP